MGNKQTIKNKNAYSSKEKRAFYIGVGISMADKLYFMYPTVKNYLKTLSKSESESFSNGWRQGMSYEIEQKIKNKKNK